MVIAIQRQPLAMSESCSPIPKHPISKAFGKFLVAIRSWLMSELEFVRSEIRRRFRINYSAACSAVPYTYYVWARWPEYGGGKRKLERLGEWARCASAFRPRFRLAASKHIAFATPASSLGFHNFGWGSCFVNIN